MNGAFWTVLRKELRESLRDRRTLISALLLGPLFGPLLLSVSLQVMVNRNQASFDEPIEIAVAHAERAPNVVAFLRENAVNAAAVKFDDAAARTALRSNEYKMVLVVPPNFATRFAAADPAPLLLYADASDSVTERSVARVRNVLQQYGQSLAQMRLIARGIDPRSLLPIAVQSVDVSTPESRGVLALGILSYLIIFATLMGGLYLAIDATAGERERGSLESLLTTPVPRRQIIYGKIAAAAVLMLLSLTVTVCTCAGALRFIRLEDFGMTANLGAGTALAMIAATAPIVLAGAALMTVIASFTRSYREAQTYLGLVMLLPTLPLAFANMLGLKPTLSLMAIPSLSQHFLITSLLRNEAIRWIDFAVSAGASLTFGMLLAWAAGQLYERESILG